MPFVLARRATREVYSVSSESFMSLTGSKSGMGLVDSANRRRTSARTLPPFSRSSLVRRSLEMCTRKVLIFNTLSRSTGTTYGTPFLLQLPPLPPPPPFGPTARASSARIVGSFGPSASSHMTSTSTTTRRFCRLSMASSRFDPRISKLTTAAHAPRRSTSSTELIPPTTPAPAPALAPT